MKLNIARSRQNTTSHENLTHTAQAGEIVLSNAELAAVQGGQCPYSQPLPPSACGDYSNSSQNYGQPSYSSSQNYGQNSAPNYGQSYGQNSAPNYGPSDTTGSCGNSAPSYSIVIAMPSVSSSCGY